MSASFPVPSFPAHELFPNCFKDISWSDQAQLPQEDLGGVHQRVSRSFGGFGWRSKTFPPNLWIIILLTECLLFSAHDLQAKYLQHKSNFPTSNIVLTSFSAFIGKLTWSGGHPWPIDDPPWSFNGVRTSPVTLVMTCQRKPFPSVPPLPVTAAACRCRPVAIRCLREEREEREERAQKRQSWNFWKMVMMYSYSCLLIFWFFMQSIRGWKWKEENFHQLVFE